MLKRAKRERGDNDDQFARVEEKREALKLKLKRKINIYLITLRIVKSVSHYVLIEEKTITTKQIN